MKELLKLTGGYKRHMNYLLQLQAEVMGVQNSILKNLGHDLVLSGCAVTDHQNGAVSIAGGYVYVSGEILRFTGQANIPADGSKALSLGTPVVTDPKEFFDTTIKATYKETFAVVADVVNATKQIVLGVKLYDIPQFIADVVQSYGQKGETKFIKDLDGLFLNNFDSSGAGVTPKWLGWHLMNGNAGTDDMAGRTLVGVGALVDDYGLEHNFTPGQKGGKPRHQLSILEMPSHDHDQPNTPPNNGSATGNATSHPDGPLQTKKTGKTGGDQPHTIMSPFLAGYWVIKLS